MQSSYIIFFMLFIILYIQRRNNGVMLRQFLNSKKKEDKKEMLELAKNFINKECIIYTFNAQLTGVIREVSSGAILLDNKGTTEAVNLDFIVRIREYPKNKNGKKKSVILD